MGTVDVFRDARMAYLSGISLVEKSLASRK